MTTDTAVQTKGLVDATNRILRELIRTPKFKETIIILLKSIDPPAARSLVRTLFWEDPGLLLSIIGTLPSLINLGSEALAETANQMNSMPTLLLQDFINRIVSGIDGAAAGEAAGGLVTMVLSLQGEDSGLAKSMSSLGEEFGRAYTQAAGGAPLVGQMSSWMKGIAEKARDKESTTYAFIHEASKALKKNPDFVEYVLKPLLSPALKTPAKKSGAQGRQAAKPKQTKED